MKKLLLFFVVMFAFLPGCTEQEVMNASEDDIEETYDAVADMFEDFENRKVRGSCNAIGKGSTCVDYVGLYWENSEFATLNCTGPGQVFSENTCPYPDNGGCQAGAGTVFETVVWMYPYGGSPVTGDALKAAITSCNLIMGSQWIAPEF